MTRMRTRLRAFLFTGVAALLAACADNPISPRNIETNLHLLPIASPALERLVICKAGPAGTYTFQANASHPVLVDVASGVHNLSAASYSVTVTAGSTIDIGGTVQQGACATFFRDDAGTEDTHNHVGLASGSVDASVTVTETGIPAGIEFDHVVVYQNEGGTVTTSSSDVNSAVGRLGGGTGGLTGAAIVFHNVALPVFSGNSINVQRVAISPVRDAAGSVTSFTGSFLITAFDQPVTVTDFTFKLSRNGDQPFWTGDCTTNPGTPLNVAKSTVASVTILSCDVVAPGTLFKKGDDVKLTVQATLATGRVFSNTGFFKVP